MKTKEIYSKLPSDVKSILVLSNGWLVGSAVEKVLNGETPKDYDIIVPDSEGWKNVFVYLKRIYTKLEVNTYGGIKVTSEGFSFDIWPETLDSFINTAKSYKYIYNCNHQNLIEKSE